MSEVRQPVFYDTTLRDGNQSLKHPWNHQEKEEIFDRLIELGIKVIEIGFPMAGPSEYESCRLLAQKAPHDVTVSVLARALPEDVEMAAQVLQGVCLPRIHVFVMMNPLGLQYVLKKDLAQVTEQVVQVVKQAKSLLPVHGQVEFSVENFGDCKENLPQVLNALDEIVKAGADVINLANTVERTHPLAFVQMVQAAKAVIQDRAQLSVHCHNDLGMATATTVESFFAGATQLETTINGLGERCGNANMFEVAMALYNSGELVPLKMSKFYEVSQVVSKLSGVPIWEKAPLMGRDCFLHRSGVHQDGANKTKMLSKGQYLPYRPEIIGRLDGERMAFTSQSGKSALQSLCSEVGHPLSVDQALQLMSKAKFLAEQKGELSQTDLTQLCTPSV